MIQSMFGLPEPPSITKVNLQERDVSLDILTSTIPVFIIFTHFLSFTFYIAAINSTTASSCTSTGSTTTQGYHGKDAHPGNP